MSDKISTKQDQAVSVGDIEWRDPEIDPPPTGRKLYLLTPGEVAVIGNWSPEYIGWQNLFRIPQSIRDKKWRGTEYERRIKDEGARK